MALIETRGLRRIYDLDAGRVVALDQRSLDIEQGRFRRRDGSVRIGQIDVHESRRLPRPADGRAIPPRRNGCRKRSMPTGLRALRNREIGFVFQQFNLLPRTRRARAMSNCR